VMASVITVEESKGINFETEYVEGMQLGKGYIAAYFVTNSDCMEAVVEDAYLLITAFADEGLCYAPHLPPMSATRMIRERSLQGSPAYPRCAHPMRLRLLDTIRSPAQVRSRLTSVPSRPLALLEAARLPREQRCGADASRVTLQSGAAGELGIFQGIEVKRSGRFPARRWSLARGVRPVAVRENRVAGTRGARAVSRWHACRLGSTPTRSASCARRLPRGRRRRAHDMQELHARGLQFSLVLADSLYGESGEFTAALHQLGLRYVVAIRSSHVVWTGPGRAQALHPLARVRPRLRQWRERFPLHPGGCFRAARVLELTLLPDPDPPATGPQQQPRETTWFVLSNRSGMTERAVSDMYGRHTQDPRTDVSRPKMG
jgi:hypothetical protein